MKAGCACYSAARQITGIDKRRPISAPIKASTFLCNPRTKRHLCAQFIGQQIIKALFFQSSLEGIRKGKLSPLDQTLAGRPGGLLIRARLLDAAPLQDRLLSVTPACGGRTKTCRRRRHCHHNAPALVGHRGLQNTPLCIHWDEQ